MTSVQEFARSVLFGDTLEAKFAPVPDLTPLTRHGLDARTSFEAPAFPGRPGRLAQIGKAEFPGSLRLDTERGRVLHFFANHELLAMELMALALLKFPDAPVEFRASLVRTIQEEQAHLRLYLTRMRELGVDFGDLPVSDYFWKAMREVRSPLEFVTQMSLTLEQANLDFSLFYRDAVRESGDETTARILDQVYQDEIGHVKNGLVWFERWRKEGEVGDGVRGMEGVGPDRAASVAPAASNESTWDAYCRLLPPPMTPSRAKGRGFTEEGRRAAGFTEDFIRALKLESSSKGRPPMLRWYDPEAERQIAHSRRAPSGFTPTATAERLARDLEPLLTFVSGRHDLLRVRELPSLEWRESCARIGYELPEYVLWNAPLRERKLAGLAPWAWSEQAWRDSLELRDRLTPASGGNSRYCESLLAEPSYPLAGIFSKSWLDRPLEHSLPVRDPAGREYRDEPELRAELAPRLAAGKKFAAKAPYGASGTQVQRLDSISDLEGPRGGWLSGVIRDQGGIWIEPWVEIEAELSVQIEVRSDRTEVLGVRQFETGPRREFRGTWLDPQLRSLGTERLTFFHSSSPHSMSPLDQLLEAARLSGERLRAAGYQGPAGIDAYVWRDERGQLRFQPLSELNPRYTMGRIALALEKRIKPGATARWRWGFRKDVAGPAGTGTTRSLVEFARELSARQPAELSPQGLLKKGVFFTNDPACAREVLTYVEVT